jgi:hypothetical protein
MTRFWDKFWDTSFCTARAAIQVSQNRLSRLANGTVGQLAKSRFRRDIFSAALSRVLGQQWDSFGTAVRRLDFEQKGDITCGKNASPKATTFSGL